MDDRLDLLHAYRCLGLDPGADLPAVEARYRARVMALHPDRHAGGTHDAAAALTALSAARRLLRDHQRRFGRLPTATELLPPPMPVSMPGPSAPPRPRPRRPRRQAALAAAVVAFGAWAVIELGHPVQVPPSPTTDAASTLPAQLPPTDRARIRLGSSEEEVLAILGRPAYARNDVWEYGPSRIEFEAGRVSGWYSSPLAPLPVDEHRPLGVRDPLDAH